MDGRARSRRAEDGPVRESSMTWDDLVELREQLLAREHLLQAEVAGHSLDAAVLAEPGDDGDAAHLVNRQDETVALLRRECRELHDIELALQRMETGHYGICSECKKAIAPKRLEALPAAIRCLSCQEAREVRSR